MNATYFANLPAQDIAPAIYEKIQQYYDELNTNGRLSLFRKSYRYYYALDDQGRHEASEIGRGGDAGELSLLKANHYRNLLQHLLVLTTQQRPAFECRAVNTDSKSMMQTILGRNVLEYYLRVKRLDRLYRQAAELALVDGDAFIEIDWDSEAGEPAVADADPEGNLTGGTIKVGDIVARVYASIDVPREIKARASSKHEWLVVRSWESRWELAARYPHLAQQILDHSDDLTADTVYYNNLPRDPESEDLIPVYTFYHDQTAACKTGRKVKQLGNSIVLEYGDLDDDEIPVYSMTPQTQQGVNFGYTVGFDLLCVQEAIDLLYSTILSNQATFGVQNIWMKPGSNLIESQLGGGLNILESNEKPEPINLTHTPQEIFNFLKGLEQLGEVLSGVNSVARGQPEASLKSGSALALVASQAVQFSNGLQQAYVQLLEDTATSIIKKLQKRAALPRTAAIAGKANRSYVKSFVGGDLTAINRVIVDVGNPMAQTLAGRTQMAQDMLQAQAITAEEYAEVITTGRAPQSTEAKMRRQIATDAENEALREGKPVIAVVTDKHIEHVNAHAILLDDPDARMDPELVRRVNAHMQEHINILRTADPALLNALGQAPIAVQPNGAPTPPQGDNAPQPNAQPAPGEQVPPPEGTPPEMAAALPSMPAPPPGAPVPPAA